jgi:nicotinate-nucleotide pyrophosphorylase (carboxylating)
VTGFVPQAPDEAVLTLIRMALAEDVASGDRTTRWTVPDAARGRARIVAKAPLVVAGMRACRQVFTMVDPELSVTVEVGDGESAAPGDVVLRVEGALASILTAERTALNVLQRLSGVATLTRAFADAVQGTGTRVVDTRKTTPGWRLLEKEAVRAGGGHNHRMGLWDMVLIKENHVAAAGGIEAAVRAVRERNQEGLAVEVEVNDLDEFDEALGLGVDRILLDNMSLDDMREAVRRVGNCGEPRPELEASGNVTLDRIGEIAATGVDLVSVGALTHSAPAVDLSLLVEAVEGGAP